VNWQLFFEVWGYASGTCSVFAFMVLAFGSSSGMDKRYWLIPASLAFLAAVFGSIAGFLTR
jgi:hypothetical protein